MRRVHFTAIRTGCQIFENCVDKTQKKEFVIMNTEQAGGWVLCISPEEPEVEEVEENWEVKSCMEKARHCFASRGVEVGGFFWVCDNLPTKELENHTFPAFKQMR